MAACGETILSSILQDCNNKAKAGIEVKVWAFNRADVTFTQDPITGALLTGFTLAAGTQSYIFEGVRNSQNAGNDLVVSDTAPKSYTHYFQMFAQARTAAEVENIYSIDDVVIVVEAKDKGASMEGAFEVYGKDTGLYQSSETRRTNDEFGRFNMELTSQEGQEEARPHYVLLDTDYATTLAALVASETPTP